MSCAFAPVRKLEAGDVGGASGACGPCGGACGACGVDAFDCGQPVLNRYLQRYAWINQKANSAQTYVVCAGVAVAGYYSLSVAGVAYAETPDRIAKGLARHPVPVMLLGRLAVGREYQGRGLGTALLKDALLRTLQAADIAGIRALLVHAKDEDARQWYLKFDFEPGPLNPMHLFLFLKDIQHAVR